MKKNVAGQIVGVQMVSATDGSAFTGTVSVVVTKDGGTQTAGGGTVTHEGNGFHTYTATQGETNADHVGFTFTGTGAVPTTIQVYPSFPQTGDSFTRTYAKGTDITGFNDLSAAQVNTEADTALSDYGALKPTVGGRTLDVSSGGEAGVDWANVGSPTTVVGLSGTTVKTATDVETDTQDIQSRLPAALVGGRIDSNAGAISGDATAADNLEAALDGTGGVLISAGLVGNVTGNLSGSVGSIGSGGISSASFAAGAITATVIATGAIDADALAADAVDEILDEQIGDSTITMRQALKILVAALAGKLSGAATTSVVIRNIADSANVISATVDADGNRSAVTVNV